MDDGLRILALETTGASGSVAALVGGRIVAERDLQSGQRSAQSMAPGIAELLREVGWQPRDVQLLAVTVGPGSFTGLRVGVTTAKTFAYATGAAVIGVDAMLVVAAQIPADETQCWATFDAQRGELVVAHVRRTGSAPFEVQRIGEPQIVDAEQWLGALPSDVIVSGPGLLHCKTLLRPATRVADERLWQPQAGVVGQIGWRDYRAGARQDLWSLSPVYFRPSAAEEKLAATGKK
jgi:tRNA threonylcarbamoyladenosine biosynthesis protein TsaB